MKTVSKVSLKEAVDFDRYQRSKHSVHALSRNDFEIESLQGSSEYLLLGLSVTVAAWCTKVLRLYLLSRRESIGYFRLFEIYVCGLVIHVTPFPPVACLYGLLMHKEGQPIGRSSTVSIIDSALTSLANAAGPALLYMHQKAEYA